MSSEFLDILHKAIEEMIDDEIETIQSEIPDCIGGALLSDYLAHECPFDMPEKIDWVVAEDDSEE